MGEIAVSRNRLEVIGVILAAVGVAGVIGGWIGKTQAETDARISRGAEMMTAGIVGRAPSYQSAELTGWWFLVGAGALLAVVGVVLFAVSFAMND